MARCIMVQGQLGDFTWVDGHFINGAQKNGLSGNQPVLIIQIQDQKDFFLRRL